jgi:RNA polymerase sigma-70 factor (ECF subfamily)
MKDEKIVGLYWERSESAISESNKKYGHYCHSIAYNILQSHEDSDECVNDTWSSAWNAMPPKKPSRLQAFLGRITRNIAIDRYRYNTRDKRSAPYTVMLSELEDVLPDPESMTETEDGRIIALLNQFVASLDPRTRVLFVRRYVRCESVEELARRFGMGENAVSSRLYRARNKLRKLLRKENVRI